MGTDTEALPPLPDRLKAEAMAIFNDPPSMTSQEVRDVIEWYDASLRAALAQRQQVPANALLRLWPAIEKAMSGLVFTAGRAGEVQADMNAVRAALTAAPQAAESVAPNDRFPHCTTCNEEFFPFCARGDCPGSAELEKAAAPQVAQAQPSANAERVRALVNAGPFPGMSEAFDAHMGAACWTEPEYRPDAAMWAAAWKAAQAQPQEPPRSAPLTEEQIDSLRGLDTASRVRFYEHNFYVLSNFSAFTLYWRGLRFDTSEAAYHFEKFTDAEGALVDVRAIRHSILTAPSAHEAFKIAERNKAHRRPDWDEVKVGIMLDILRAKAGQHEYVRRKLLATGDRELVEDSWRDDFWGWGPNRNGKNMLGKLWMQVRAELRGISTPEEQR